MLAACSVLFSHSFTLALGADAKEPLQETGLSLGSIAVTVFFCLSGFLIAKSADRSRTLAEFWTARALRLLPGLFVSLFVSAYLLGALTTSLPVMTYLARPYTAHFVFSGLTLFHNQAGLPGVFENNPLPDVVNCSLWTLRFEVYCYAMAALCGLIGWYRRSLFAMSLFAFVLLYSFVRIEQGTATASTTSGLFLMPPFVVGIAMYVYRSTIPLNPWIAISTIASTILLRHTAVYFEAVAITCAYTTLYLGFFPVESLLNYNRLGDYSYGIYIYAFPLQQTLAHFVKHMSGMQMFCISFAATLVISILSWTYIERPALGLKQQALRAFQR